MKKWFLALGSLALPLAAQAGTLSTGENIKLLVVDGKKVESSFWSETSAVNLPAGKHQIVVRFDGEVKDGSKTRIYTTRPYLFEMEVPTQNATITLPRLSTLSQAEAYFQRGPEWQLELAGGAKQPLEYVELQGKGFAAFSDMEALVAEYNREHGITFEEGYAVDLEKAAVEVSDKGEISITGDALVQLKLWYSKANADEKAAFEQWVKTQANQ
ncbi:YccT family protein [Photobacterium ganghwense]|uniref:YccT family protein n=1 Tax=Photobacterium ganghwense TaxID=320778 RepID=UPI004055DE44